MSWAQGSCSICGRTSAPKFIAGKCNACYIREKRSQKPPQKCKECDKVKNCHHGGVCNACYTNLYCNRTIHGLFIKAKNLAKAKNVKWLLTQEEYNELRSKACFYCGGPLNKSGTGLDRIKGDKEPYSIDNVLPCCGSCSMIRGDNLSVVETIVAIAAVHDRRRDAHLELIDHNIDIDGRTLFMIGEISDLMFEQLLKGINIMESINRLAPIRIILSSPGGDWVPAISIYDRIKASACPISIEVLGFAWSGASVIFQAATDRIIHPNATLMIHNGTVSIEDSVTTASEIIALSRRDLHTMYSIYSEVSGLGIDYWAEKCQNDFYITAHEAIDLGLADRIPTQRKPPAWKVASSDDITE